MDNQIRAEPQFAQPEYLKPALSPLAQVIRTIFSPLGYVILALGLFVLANFVLPTRDGPGRGWSALLFAVSFGISAVEISFLLSVAVHELGHVVGGWLVGHHFVALSIGPLVLRANERRLCVKLARTWQLSGVAATAPMTDHHLIQRDMFSVASGPAFSLLLASTAYMVYPHIHTGGRIGGINYFFRELMKLSIWVSLWLGVTSLIPRYMKKPGILTDGGRLMMLSRGGPEALRWSLMRRIHGAILSGVRPRDWNPEWIRQITDLDEPDASHVSAIYFGYLWALDRTDYAQAGAFLDQGRELLNKGSLEYHSYLLQAVFFEALYRRNAKQARAWFDEAKNAPVMRSTLRRAEASVLLVEEHYEAARLCALEGLQAAKDEGEHDTALGQLEAEWFHAIIAEATEADRHTARVLVESER